MSKPQDSNDIVIRSPHNTQKNIPRTAWITLAILGFTQIITMYGETMLLPAIPDIIEDFDISYNTSSWILSAYLIAGAVATPIAGKLSDIYGRKKMVVIIMIIYIFGITMGGLSADITFLVTTRVIQGFGISMFPIAFGIIRDQFPKGKLAIAVGVFTSMSSAGSVVGLVLGASIIEDFGWRATFFSIIPVAIGLWFGIMRYIRDSPSTPEDVVNYTKKETFIDNSSNKLKRGYSNASSPTRSIDIKGAVTLATAITSFLMVLAYSGGDIVMSSPQRIGFLSIGTVSLVLFVIISLELLPTFMAYSADSIDSWNLFKVKRVNDLLTQEDPL